MPRLLGALVLVGVPTGSVVAQDVTAPVAYKAEISAAKASMMSDPPQALSHARAAAGLARRAPASASGDADAAVAVWLEAEALYRLDRNAEALPLATQALEAAHRVARNSRLEGDLRLTHGHIKAALGAPQEAMADYQAAYEIFVASGAPRSAGLTLGQIGSIYADARDYAQAIRYYQRAHETYAGDKAFDMAFHNNMGDLLAQTARHRESEAEYTQALNLAIELKNHYLEASILNNLAANDIAEHRDAAARSAIQTALGIARRYPAAGLEMPFLYGQLARLDLQQGDLAQALRNIERAFAGVNLETTGPDFLDFHRAAVAVYERTGQAGQALRHFRAQKRLEEAATQLSISTTAALTTAQFNFADQKLRIEQLKSAALKKDIELARTREQWRWAATVMTGIGLMIIAVLVLYTVVSLRRSRDQLRATNDQLSRSNAALQTALNVKRDFLAMASHEIRTPLNGVLALTEALTFDQSVNEGLREKLRTVVESGRIMRALVDDLMTLGTSEMGEFVPHMSTIDAADVLRQSVDAYRAAAEAKGLELVLDLDPALATLVTDETRLRQIVQNLTFNAIKFTDAGRVAVSVALRGGPGAEMLVLEVSDTGIGIAEADQDRIFEPFIQVETGLGRRFSGAGLGLSICATLVGHLGGTIAVRSRPGQGSTFTVNLPIERPVIATSTPVEGPAAAEAGPQDVVYALAPSPMDRGLLKVVVTPVCRALVIFNTAEELWDHMATAPCDTLIVDGAQLDAIHRSGVLTAIADLTAPPRVIALIRPEDVGPALQDPPFSAVVARPLSKAGLLEALQAPAPLRAASHRISA